MQHVIRMAAALWFGLSGVASAGETVVVELFTSQGCSSCPPADRILGELAERDDIIALSLHVDYWDYLGWKDEFASPEHTLRQRAYARAKGERSIYTPQMVIAGQDHVVGSRPMKVSASIQKHREVVLPARVKLERDGDTVKIVVRARGNVPKSVVQLVTFKPKSSVQIRKGENAGRTIEYHNVVQRLTALGTWNGTADYTVSVKVPADTPVAVLVQQSGIGPILGAAQLR